MAASEDAGQDVGRLAAPHPKEEDVLAGVVLDYQYVGRAPRAAGLLHPSDYNLIERGYDQFSTA